MTIHWQKATDDIRIFNEYIFYFKKRIPETKLKAQRKIKGKEDRNYNIRETHVAV